MAKLTITCESGFGAAWSISTKYDWISLAASCCVVLCCEDVSALLLFFILGIDDIPDSSINNDQYTIQYNTIHHNTLHYITLHYITLQWVYEVYTVFK